MQQFIVVKHTTFWGSAAAWPNTGPGLYCMGAARHQHPSSFALFQAGACGPGCTDLVVCNMQEVHLLEERRGLCAALAESQEERTGLCTALAKAQDERRGLCTALAESQEENRRLMARLCKLTQ